MANDPDQPPKRMLERKLVTILSADVAEYSRLMAEDEEQTLRIFREYSETFSALVESHQGRIFNTAGDAILAAEFSNRSKPSAAPPTFRRRCVPATTFCRPRVRSGSASASTSAM